MEISVTCISKSRTLVTAPLCRQALEALRYMARTKQRRTLNIFSVKYFFLESNVSPHSWRYQWLKIILSSLDSRPAEYFVKSLRKQIRQQFRLVLQFLPCTLYA